MVKLIVDMDNAHVRLDRFLRKRLALKSLTEIYRLIRTGVRVDGKRCKQGFRLEVGQIITVPLPDAEIVEERGLDYSLADLAKTDYYRKNFNLLFEDEHLMVCDKPANLVVHSGTGHARRNTLIDLAAAHLAKTSKKGQSTEPSLVHRLDKDTSGVILIAKDKRTVRILHEKLRERDIDKRYIALCHGRPDKNQGVIDAGLIRRNQSSKEMKMQVSSRGREARSHYTVKSCLNGISSLEVRLETGRTHQIRVHLAHAGLPIIGDSRYGDGARDAQILHMGFQNRLYLHAHQITFYHPYLNRDVTFVAPEPESFSRLRKNVIGPLR